jgi:DNA-binding GntR family transcriptional regulator
VPAEDQDKFKNTSRTDFVYEQLREAIRSKHYRSGDRVRESEVADWLGVSRTPVREAMNRLISEHLLVDSQARGIMVAELEQQQVRELYALRENLEGMAASLAAIHAAPDEIESLRDYLAQTKDHFDNPQAQHKLNQHLHEAIYDAARNRYLSQALRKLSDSLDLLRGTTYQLAKRPERAYEEHREIIEAIARRDPAAAEAAARGHMREACRIRMRQIFGPQV